MEYTLEAKVRVTLEHSPGEKLSAHKSTDFGLRIALPLDEKKYFDAEGRPNADGCKAITVCMVHGLIGNIHAAHKKGHRNDAEHLRWCIDELERLFVQNTNITDSEF